jgi:hypothetical protein
MNNQTGTRQALFLSSDSGSGKTTALLKTLLKRPEFRPYPGKEGEVPRPLTRVVVPKPLTLKLFVMKAQEAAGQLVTQQASTAGVCPSKTNTPSAIGSMTSVSIKRKCQ